jgi:hypothetical protein
VQELDESVWPPENWDGEPEILMGTKERGGRGRWVHRSSVFVPAATRRD